MAANSRLAKGPVVGLFQKFKFFNMARPELYGGSYMKNLAAEAPELIACAATVSLHNKLEQEYIGIPLFVLPIAMSLS